jgi:hypothetical protein
MVPALVAGSLRWAGWCECRRETRRKPSPGLAVRPGRSVAAAWREAGGSSGP